MTSRKAPPEIFDSRAAAMRRARAAKREASFLSERCAHDTAERLQDINRQFERALIIAPPEFHDQCYAALPDNKKPRVTDLATSPDDMAASPDGYDLIISILNLHGANDLPGQLIQIQKNLKPDGLFIGAMFGGETLTELRQVLYAADQKHFDGVSPRVFPFADYSQSAQLLQRTGFALPVIDADRFTVNYRDLDRLVSDLRDIGETNYLVSRNHAPLSASYWKDAKAIYSETFGTENGTLKCSFEILWLTGWSPYDSQQKPLKPGSAKMRLADALQAKETPLKPD